ncbi:hypothetical protein [Halomicrococcus sp. NG-SE-24]|uniref:hypothetical protein n=1 Tax=Halomicrococcus sp. NG-SE-24 TaxID=3436928 RepID=UPI003D96FEDF
MTTADDILYTDEFTLAYDHEWTSASFQGTSKCEEGISERDFSGQILYDFTSTDMWSTIAAERRRDQASLVSRLY